VLKNASLGRASVAKLILGKGCPQIDLWPGGGYPAGFKHLSFVRGRQLQFAATIIFVRPQQPHDRKKAVSNFSVSQTTSRSAYA